MYLKGILHVRYFDVDLSRDLQKGAEQDGPVLLCSPARPGTNPELPDLQGVYGGATSV